MDLGDAGVAIVLPALPRLTQACFRLMRNDEPVNLLARNKNTVEGAYEGQHQFGAGFQFTAVFVPEGSLKPLSE